MRTFDALLLVVLVCASGALYFVWSHRYVPCVTPVSYGLVELDPRLDISAADFESALREAASAWNSAIGKKILIESYKPEVGVYGQYGKLESAIDDGRGGQFGQGEYVSDKSGQRMYIFGFKNRTDLARALEHEFGHALGLEHVSDPGAVMYYASNANTNGSAALSAVDLEELNRVCGL